MCIHSLVATSLSGFLAQVVGWTLSGTCMTPSCVLSLILKLLLIWWRAGICCDTVLQSVELSVFASKQDLSSSALSLADSPIMKLLSCLAVEMIFTLSERNCEWVINWLCFLLLSFTARWLLYLLHKWKQIQSRSRRGP